jgi:hypothetical protein
MFPSWKVGKNWWKAHSHQIIAGNTESSDEESSNDI